jgi:transglutaminase-like putative cysteine protease
MELNITYKAFNTYKEPVSEAIYEFILLPALNQHQITYGVELENSIQKYPYKYKNLYGFDVVRIRTTESFGEMNVVMNANVFTKTFNPFDFMPPNRETSNAIMSSIDYYIENHLFLKQSPLTALPIKKIEEFIKWEHKESIFEFILRLNLYLNSNFKYEKNATTVKTSASEFVELKKGVCQDFAHLFVAICRANKIPARYVSGYLNQDTNYTGTSMMHAWVEVNIPTVGWIGIDPTNNLLIDENYVKVAHGCDYKDCSPIKGILFTNGENTSKYEVSVRQTQQ